MAAIVVLEFNDPPPANAFGPVFPYDRRTAVTVSGATSHTLNTNTKFALVCLTAGDLVRMTMGSDVPTTADFPLIAEIGNPVDVKGGAYVLNFIDG